MSSLSICCQCTTFVLDQNYSVITREYYRQQQLTKLMSKVCQNTSFCSSVNDVVVCVCVWRIEWLAACALVTLYILASFGCSDLHNSNHQSQPRRARGVLSCDKDFDVKVISQETINSCSLASLQTSANLCMERCDLCGNYGHEMSFAKKKKKIKNRMSTTTRYELEKLWRSDKHFNSISSSRRWTKNWYFICSSLSLTWGQHKYFLPCGHAPPKQMRRSEHSTLCYQLLSKHCAKSSMGADNNIFLRSFFCSSYRTNPLSQHFFTSSKFGNPFHPFGNDLSHSRNIKRSKFVPIVFYPFIISRVHSISLHITFPSSSFRHRHRVNCQTLNSYEILH